MDKKIEELAQLYGIEIRDVEAGKGGLFFVNPEGVKESIADIFDPADYTTPMQESVYFKKCSVYSTYFVLADLCAA